MLWVNDGCGNGSCSMLMETGRGFSRTTGDNVEDVHDTAGGAFEAEDVKGVWRAICDAKRILELQSEHNGAKFGTYFAQPLVCTLPRANEGLSDTKFVPRPIYLVCVIII